MTPRNRRASDHFTARTAVLTIVGVALIGATIALKVLFNISDTLVIALVAAGGTIIPGTHIASALKAWKGQ
jgi:hypothetical protein